MSFGRRRKPPRRPKPPGSQAHRAYWPELEASKLVESAKYGSAVSSDAEHKGLAPADRLDFEWRRLPVRLGLLAAAVLLWFEAGRAWLWPGLLIAGSCIG